MNLNRLKRFDKAKHEQLEGLMQWCQLMGLSGKDLVSLGGHIDRYEASQEWKRNKEIIASMKLFPIGEDITIHHRWNMKTDNGTYKFEIDGGHYVNVTNTKTKTKRRFTPGGYNVGSGGWRQRHKMCVLLDVYHGVIKLDF